MEKRRKTATAPAKAGAEARVAVQGPELPEDDPEAPKKKQLSYEAILAKLRSQPTISVPETGFVLAGLGKNASYDAATTDKLGVPVMDIGGLKRCASIFVLRKLGLAENSTPTKPTEATAELRRANRECGKQQAAAT